MKRQTLIGMAAIVLGVGSICYLVHVRSRMANPHRSQPSEDPAATDAALTSNQAHAAPVRSPSEDSSPPSTPPGKAAVSASATSNRPEANPPARRRAGMGPLQIMTEALGLTDEQAKKLAPVLKEQQDKVAATRRDTTLSRQERRAKYQEMQQTADIKINQVLTPEQAQQWRQMRSGPQLLSSGQSPTNLVKFWGADSPAPSTRPTRTGQQPPANQAPAAAN